jgi:hypothetical protein
LVIISIIRFPKNNDNLNFTELQIFNQVSTRFS